MKHDGNADIRQLTSFMEIVKEGSFTQASRNLRLGQATVSHHISNLEEWTGAPLFIRSGRKVELTREGRLLEEFCRNLFSGMENLREKLKEGDAVRPLLIAASNIPGIYLLPRVLGRLKEGGNALGFKIELSDSREVIEKVKEGTVEIGFTGSRLSHPMLEFEKVAGDRIILIGPADGPETLELSDLKNQDFILRQKGSGTRTAWENFLNSRGVSPAGLKAVCECSASECVKQSVIAGLGLAFISDQAVSRKIKAGLMREIEIPNMDLKREFFMVRRSDRNLGREELLVVAEMKRIFG